MSISPIAGRAAPPNRKAPRRAKAALKRLGTLRSALDSIAITPAGLGGQPPEGFYCGPIPVSRLAHVAAGDLR